MAAVLAAVGIVCLPRLPMEALAEGDGSAGEAPRKKLIALTFDDGPNYYTISILDALEEHGAHATFFVRGDWVHNHADTMRRAVAIGCEVAGHAWNRLSPAPCGGGRPFPTSQIIAKLFL